VSATELLSPARAVRLRRIAEMIDEQADRGADPAKARMVARAMRLRASELEAGRAVTDEQEATRLMAELGSDAAP
jgi:hypothetical protein